MAKRTTKAGNTDGEAAPERAATRKRAATPARKTTKRAAPKATKATPKRAATPARERAPRRPSRVKALGSSISALANRVLAQADDEAVKNILTAGALAAAAVMLGEAAAEAVDEDPTRADAPPNKTKLKAAAAAGGAAMGAQLLKTLEDARERKGLASSDAFDPKALAAKAMTALMTSGGSK